MDDETIDMTGASDAEVLKVFKAMSDSDGIVVTKNDNIISLNDGDNEYMIKINEEEEEGSLWLRDARPSGRGNGERVVHFIDRLPGG